jgi:hypothetical protein
MDAKSFLEKHGRDTAERVALSAGTNWPYFSQIAHGHRRPSVDLARKLVTASEEVVSDKKSRLDLVSLLPSRQDRAA